MQPSDRARWQLVAVLAALAVLVPLAGGHIEAASLAVWSARGLAGLGLYGLARELGLGPQGAALAGLALALSAPLSPPFSASVREYGPPAAAWLPWLLLGLERGRRSASGQAIAALAQAGMCASAAAAEVVAGSLAALAWCLAEALRGRTGARRGLAALAGGTLIAGLWGALPGWPAPEPAPGEVDLLALGVLCLGAAALARGWSPAAGRAQPTWRALLAGLGLALVVAWLAWRGLDPWAGELVAPGLRPPRAEPLLPRIPLPALGLALALLLGGEPGQRRQAELAVLAWVALLVSLAAPGLGDLWRALPVLGDLEPAGAAGVAALALALAAGAGFESAARHARLRAAAALVGLGALAFVGAGSAPPPPLTIPTDAPDELFAFELETPARVSAPVRVSGQVDAGLPLELVRLGLWPLDGTAPVRVVEGEPGPPGADGARAFLLAAPGRLEPGRWLARLELLGAEEEGVRARLGTRLVGMRFVPPGPRRISAAGIALLLALLALLPPRSRAAGWCALLAVALAGLCGY